MPSTMLMFSRGAGGCRKPTAVCRVSGQQDNCSRASMAQPLGELGQGQTSEQKVFRKGRYGKRYLNIIVVSGSNSG